MNPGSVGGYVAEPKLVKGFRTEKKGGVGEGKLSTITAPGKIIREKKSTRSHKQEKENFWNTDTGNFPFFCLSYIN
jgi:hypothetical protein